MNILDFITGHYSVKKFIRSQIKKPISYISVYQIFPTPILTDYAYRGMIYLKNGKKLRFSVEGNYYTDFDGPKRNYNYVQLHKKNGEALD